MYPDYTFLNDTTTQQLQDWLVEALHGRTSLPSVSPDEFPYLAILRVESVLDKPTRRDLITACRELVARFVHRAEGDEDYVRSLLGLAVKLQVQELALALANMAQHSPQFRSLPLPIQRLVLTTLVEFRTQPPEFWQIILDQDQDAFAGVAFSGLFSCGPELALTVLPRLPERPPVVAAASSRFRHWVESLELTNRSTMEAKLRQILPDCNALVRQMFGTWVPTRPAKHDWSRLATVLTPYLSTSPPVPHSQSARLLTKTQIAA